MRITRKILGSTRYRINHNDEPYKYVKKITTKIRKCKPKFFGHNRQMTPDRLTYQDKKNVQTKLNNTMG